jgi:hypothetical protein
MEARSWTQPLPPRLARPDPFLHLRLRLRDAWLDETGTWRPIVDEPAQNLWSILGYLRWHALALMAADTEAAADADPDTYLGSRPLVQAIDAELERRGCSGPGEGLALLRSIGLTPWEVAASGRVAGRRGT